MSISAFRAASSASAASDGWPVPVHASEDCLDAIDLNHLAEECRLVTGAFVGLLDLIGGR